MRTITIILTATVMAVLPVHGLYAQAEKPKKTDRAAEKKPAAVNYNELYKSAVSDYNAGRLLEAEGKFIKVLRKYPQHVQSRRYRAMIQQGLREKAAVPILKQRLSKIIAKKVEFEEATLSEVMDFIRLQAKELSGGKVTPGVVITGGDEVRERMLSFEIDAVPLDSLVEVAAKLTNTKVKYTPYAITIAPLPTAEELAAEADKKLEAAEAKERAKAAASDTFDPFKRKKR